MIIVLTKLVRGYHWWEDAGQVAIAMEHVVSMEECSERPGGRYGTRIALDNGEAYVVKQSLAEIDEAMRTSVVPAVSNDMTVNADPADYQLTYGEDRPVNFMSRGG